MRQRCSRRMTRSRTKYLSPAPARSHSSPIPSQSSAFPTSPQSMISYRTVLKREIVRFEVDIPDQRLERRARGTRADQRRVERGRDEQHGRLRVVHPRLHIRVVPDVHKRRGRGDSDRPDHTRRELALEAGDVNGKIRSGESGSNAHEERERRFAGNIQRLVVLTRANEDGGRYSLMPTCRSR